MPTTVTSPNMTLVLPIPSEEPGPGWAQEIFSALYTNVDQHNHSSSQGVQIQPSGINISSDLLFNNNNATTLRSVRLINNSVPLSGASDVGCIYESGGELWYNDSSSNQVQITKTGSVNATSSGISSGTASASFSAGTLVVLSNTSVPGPISSGAISIGNASAFPNTVTVQASSSLSASYSITLPLAAPASTSLVQMDSSGNLSTTLTATSFTTTGDLTAGSHLYVGGPSGPNLQASGSNTLINSANRFITGGSSGVGISNSGPDGGPGNVTIGAYSEFTGFGFPIVVSAQPSTNGLFIVRGTVNAARGIVSGEGFSVSAGSGTNTVITFTTAFQDVPAVSAICNFNLSAGSAGAVNLQAGPTTTGFTISTSVGSGIAYFSFIAIGQRNSST